MLFNNGVQAYIHFEAYPVFGHVGQDSLRRYLDEYENRLTSPLLIPYGLTLLVNLILIFVRPEGISLVAMLIVFILNLKDELPEDALKHCIELALTYHLKK